MKLKLGVKISLFLVTVFIISSCSKEEIIPEEVEINDFVWGGLNAYYKWQGNVEDLADTKFTNRNELNAYLEDFETPLDIFNSLIIDTDSRITDDFTIFENELEGIITTNGLSVRGALFTDVDDNLFYYAVAQSIIPNSSADLAGITPGMMFSYANGSRISALNIDTLFIEEADITLTQVDYDVDGYIVPVGSYAFEAIETDVYPIEVYQNQVVNGQTVGYFLYNHFASKYNQDLNSVFEDYRAQGIDELVIDLRYNEGVGSTDTATYLGSMITGQFDGDVFSKQTWNDKVMTNLNNSNLTTYFTDEIEYDDETSENINSLGLERIYFIVSSETDTTSLLLINSLQPYIDVQLVGYENDLTEEITGNNFLFSTILYDSDDYTKGGENYNTSHTWAIKPIVFEAFDKDGTNDINGYIPTVPVAGNPNNASVLGSSNEPLFAGALQHILQNP